MIKLYLINTQNKIRLEDYFLKKLRFYFSLAVARIIYFIFKVTKLSSGTAIIGLIVLKICPDFMKIAAKYGLPIITSSDSHKPEDCGSYIDEAIEYAKGFGYTEGMTFDHRKRIMVPLG